MDQRRSIEAVASELSEIDGVPKDFLGIIYSMLAAGEDLLAIHMMRTAVDELELPPASIDEKVRQLELRNAEGIAGLLDERRHGRTI